MHRRPLLAAPALVTALVLSAACSAPAPSSDRPDRVASSDGALVGGREAAPGEYPATVEIAGGCTAAKIGPRHFLLAAHCVHDTTANALSGAYVTGARMRVDAGAPGGGGPGADVTVAATHIFPAWTAACVAPCPVNVLAATHPADVALIEVVEETPAIAEASLDPRRVADGDRVVLAGYGCEVGLYKTFGAPAPRLKVDETAAIGEDALVHPGSFVSGGDVPAIGASFVVTAGHALDASSASLCFGDSGGPLYRREASGLLVVGINAYYTFPSPFDGVSQTNWHTRVDAAAPQGVLAWLSGLGANVRRDVPAASATVIPGRLEAEAYDAGGEGLGYHDVDAKNQGGQDRTDGVDLEATKDDGGGFDVGWTAPGEWLAFHVAVASAGTYDLALRLASPYDGKKVHVEVDGRDVTGAVDVPRTGGWQAWRTVTVPGVALDAGARVVRVVFDTDGTNLNWIDFAAETTSPATPATGTTSTAGSTPTTTTPATTSGGPCDGLCDGAVAFSGPGYSSGSLGVLAVCRETTATLASAACGGLVAPRAFTINGATVACEAGNVKLPPARNGGYCFAATAGEASWAWFATW
jgi:hypothetical protein